MCKVFLFHCEKFSCRENEHYVDEPEYCAEFEKTWFKKHKERPLWLPTKSMANTDLEPFDHVKDGLRYLHHEEYVPVGCSNIEWVDQGAKKSCPFTRDNEVRMEIYLHTLDVRQKEEAEKERKARMKFRYL